MFIFLFDSEKCVHCHYSSTDSLLNYNTVVLLRSRRIYLSNDFYISALVSNIWSAITTAFQDMVFATRTIFHHYYYFFLSFCIYSKLECAEMKWCNDGRYYLENHAWIEKWIMDTKSAHRCYKFMQESVKH